MNIPHPNPDNYENTNDSKRSIELRGQKVMLDFNIAGIYDEETRALKQAVKRNIDVFPDDFMFQLSKNE